MDSAISQLLFFIIPTILDLLGAPTMAQYSWKCSDTGSYTNGSMYQQNLNSLLSSFSSNTTQNQADSGFYNSSLGQDSNKVNAIALCRGDLGLKDCRSCLNDSTQILLRNCQNYKEAILWAPQCMVRYSQNLIFSIEEDDPVMYVHNPNNASKAFGLVLNPLLETVSNKAALGDVGLSPLALWRSG